MAAIPELIYCADGNARFAKIAIDSGWLYGAQLPARGLHYPPYFVDQNWKNPDLPQYATLVAKHRPKIASVLDWERPEQLPEVLAWAETIAPFVEIVMIIPKVIGGVASIPRGIGGKPVRLGYSVPTSFGGTAVPLSEFNGWSVHLLGGRPDRQYRLAHFLNVVSVDGNYHGMKARRFCEYFYHGQWIPDGGQTKWDAPYVVFERSCQNILAMWRGENPPKSQQLTLFR